MSALTLADIESKVFTTVRFRQGYDQAEVDEFLGTVHEQLGLRLTRLAAYDAPGTLSVGLTGADVDALRFTTVRLREGYDPRGVDDFLDLVRAGLDELDQQLTRRGVAVVRS